MKVLIIEDEHFAAERLRNLLAGTGRAVDVLAVVDSVKSAVKWFKDNPSPDLIFLDIQLADGLSFSIFEQIKLSAPVIFTTAFDEYAIQAFEVHSVDYLLKPVDPKKLQAALQKYDELKKFYQQPAITEMLSSLREGISNPKTFKSRLLINKSDSLLSLPVEQIAYILAQDKGLSVFTLDGGKHALQDSLDHLEELFDPAKFFRVNRQCLLALPSIVKVHHYFNYKLKIDTQPSFPGELIVSKMRVQEFRDWLDR
ncbi:MAG: LytTR family DNA-binding domain-containing protein [Bacteroidales bacterium]